MTMHTSLMPEKAGVETKPKSNGKLNSDIRQESAAAPQPQFEELSLLDLMVALWRYRATIVLTAIALGVVMAAVTSGYFMMAQKRHVSGVIRINFAGIEKGQYPNGLQFSANDITAPQALKAVYEANIGPLSDDSKAPVKVPGITFADFSSRFSVVRAARGLDTIEQGYLSAISDRKLSTGEREKMRERYESERRAVLNVPEYRITFDGSGLSLDEQSMQKIVKDVCAYWADYSQNTRGVYEYQIPILTADFLEKDIDDEEYLIAADILRNAMDRLSDLSDKIAALPGASLTSTGVNGTNVATIKVRINDRLKLKHRELTSLIVNTGAARIPSNVAWYIDHQRNALKLELSEANKRLEVLQNALNDYSGKRIANVASGTPGKGIAGQPATVIPQVDASFLRSLIEMADEKNNSEYRQKMMDDMILEGKQVARVERELAYYEDLRGRLAKPIEDPKERDEGIKRIEKLIPAIRLESQNILTQLRDIHAAISRQYLQPKSRFYSEIEPPRMAFVRAMSLKKLLVSEAALGIVLMSMIMFGCLVHDRFRQSKA